MDQHTRLLMQRYAEKLTQFGVSPQFSAPPAYRLLWWMRLPVPPPIYSTGPLATLIRCLLLAALWTCCMHLIAGKSLNLPLLSGSLTFGFIVALFRNIELLRLRKKLALPSWKEFSECC